MITKSKELRNDTNGETWIKGIQCGRATIQALQQHYGGDVESDKRIKSAKHTNEYIFYKVETFFFEEYFMTTKENYKVQEQYGVPAYEADKVKIFLEGIKIQTSQSKWQ